MAELYIKDGIGIFDNKAVNADGKAAGDDLVFSIYGEHSAYTATLAERMLGPDFPVCVCGRKSRGRVITRKPILPSEEELEENSRSKSAKLRVFERGEGEENQAGQKIMKGGISHGPENGKTHRQKWGVQQKKYP